MPTSKLIQSIFDRFPAASTVVDEKGKVLYCTKVATELFNKKGGKDEPKHIEELLGPETDWTELKAKDSTHTSAVNHELHGLMHLHVDRIEGNNEFLYYIQFEKPAPQEKHSLIHSSSKEMAIVIKLDGNIADCSDSSQNVFGLEPKEIIGNGFAEFIHPSERLKLLSDLNKLHLKPSERITRVYRFKNADGRYQWVESDFETVVDKNKRPIQIIAIIRDISQLVKAEEEKNEMSRLYTQIFESIGEGIVYQDQNGAITSANISAERILGLSLDQMQGRTSMHPEWKAIHEDGSDYPGETHPAMVSLRSGKESKNNIMGVYHPEEERYVWIKVNSYPLFEETLDKPSGVFTTFNDITSEYHKTKELEKNENLFRTLLDNAFQFLGLLDTEGRMIDANKTGLEFMGLSKEEIIGAHLWNTPEGTLTEKVQSKLEAAVKKATKGDFVRFDFEMKGANEQMVTLDFSLRPVVNNAGEVIMLVSEGRDITEKKNMAKSLSQYNSLMNGIVESVPSALLFTDTKGYVLRTNREAYQLLGYKSADIVGQRIDKLLPDNTMHELLTSESEDGKLDIQTTARSIQDKSIPIRLVGSNVIDLENDIFGKLYLLEDITESLEVERLRNEFTKELSAKVTERTKDLEKAKKDLEKALDAEKELNALQSHFVLSASHQFRTPLTIIQSNGELLAQLAEMVEGSSKDKFKSYSERITEQVKRTISLMDDIMLLGKITSGAVQPKLRKTNLKESLSDIIELHKTTNGANRLKLSTKGSEGEVAIDRKLFEEAVSNLISNALKYSQQDVKLQLEYLTDKTCIHVADSGLGISEDDQKNLFQPFFRSTQVMDYQGTGLGLAIAQEYIEVQGGKITVKSTKDKGTVFTICFPK